MRPLILASLLAAAVAGAPAAAAQAAERQTLDRDRPEAQFDGKFGVGNATNSTFVGAALGRECLPQDIDCERTPVRLLDGGRLNVRLENPEGPFWYQMHEVRLYEADAAGDLGRRIPDDSGREWHFGAGGLAPGDYVLVVRWWDVPGSYTGFLRLTPKLAP